MRRHWGYLELHKSWLQLSLTSKLTTALRHVSSYSVGFVLQCSPSILVIDVSLIPVAHMLLLVYTPVKLCSVRCVCVCVHARMCMHAH